MKRVLIIAAVAFVVGTGVGIAAAADPVESSDKPTANITDVEVTEDEYTVHTDSGNTARIRVTDEDGNGIHDVDLPEGVSTRSLPLDWSQYEAVSCGYAVDEPTEITILDDDYNELDRTTVNISSQTEVCK